MSQNLSLPLSMATTGQRLQIVNVAAGHRASRRLTDLGLIPGVELEIVQDQGAGALIIAVGDTRLAIERGIAHKIQVQLSPRKPAPEHPQRNDKETPSWHIA